MISQPQKTKCWLSANMAGASIFFPLPPRQLSQLALGDLPFEDLIQSAGGEDLAYLHDGVGHQPALQLQKS
jgi:hypothetical protein